MQPTNNAERMQKIKMVLSVSAVALLLIFALQNIEQATVTFLIWKWSVPRIVVLFVFFITGFVLGTVTPTLVRTIRGRQSTVKPPGARGK